MFCPINLKTHFSILKALPKPKELVKHCKSLGFNTLGLADYATLSGCVQFYEACKKEDIKPILGVTVNHEIYLAKNLNGWESLIQWSSSNFTGIPENRSHLILITGAPFSAPSSFLFNDQVGHIRDVKKHLTVGSLDVAVEDLEKRKELFPNIYLAVDRLPIFDSYDTIFDFIEDLSVELDIKCVPLTFPHYLTPEQAELHRIQICSQFKTTLKNFESIKNKDESFYRFFHSDEFFVRRVDGGKYIDNLHELMDSCGEYDILQKQRVPKFPTPNGETEHEHLKSLCRTAWKEKLNFVDRDEQKLYTERVLHELATIEDMNLSGYFLIMRDLVNWVYGQGWMCSPARGSAGGCLISYLLGITEINPLTYELFFERFLNPARKDAMADIDIDVPKYKRKEVLDYIRDTYGRSRVAQIITFGELHGRSAIQEILRVNDVASSAEINTISKSLPEQAKVEAQMDADGEKSLIRWTLNNKSESIQDYCSLDDNGELVGDLAIYFQQAIDMECTIKSTGKHASAVVVYDGEILDVCPLVGDKNSEELITQFSMEDCEKVGLLKLDCLGLSTLDKLMEVNDLLKETHGKYS